jgi:DNA-binding HxlR family transcriptional regulator
MASVANRTYGQYCGLARAVEILGERWGLLIVRDLMVAPKRFTDLQRGLPGIPSNVLTARLKELEEASVVERRVLPRPNGSIVYALTEYGQALEDTVIRMGRWGAKSLGDPRPDEIITPDSMVMALRSTFRSEAADGLRASYELRIGDVVIHARVHDGSVDVGTGELENADLIIEAGPAIRMLMAGEITPGDALASGALRIKGKRQLLARFAQIFRI